MIPRIDSWTFPESEDDPSLRPTREELTAVQADEWAEVRKYCPHYVKLVPKDYAGNVAYRKRTLKLLKDPKHAAAMRAMGKRDVLFHINTFVMAYAPKLFPAHPVQPFITYPAQSVAIVLMAKALGILPGTKQRPVHFRKSREVGGSWSTLALYEWAFQYYSRLSFLVLSATEDKVDELENLDTLIERLRFIVKMLPDEMRPETTSRTRHLYNVKTKSVIDGAATTKNTARGGYRTSVFYDELAAVQFGSEFLSGGLTTSDAPMYVSTETGPRSAFALVGKRDNVKIRIPWWRDPHKTVGLYYDKNGKPRSEWWERQKEKSVSDAQFAREIEGDSSMMGGTAWQPEVFDEHRRRNCLDADGEVIPPTHVGHLDYDSDTGEPFGWSGTSTGMTQLWIPLAGGKPGPGFYTIGVDVSLGRNASLSTASIVNLETGRKVGQFADGWIQPHELTAQCVALCNWFRSPLGEPAFLIWEFNGPGTQFATAIERMEFTNIYKRLHGRALTRDNSSPGWFANDKRGSSIKNTLLCNYVRALNEDKFINPCVVALEECKQFVYKADGKIVHTGSVEWEDPTGARANHGDRVTADALACKILLEYDSPVVKKVKVIPRDSMRGRYLERVKNMQKTSSWL